MQDNEPMWISIEIEYKVVSTKMISYPGMKQARTASFHHYEQVFHKVESISPHAISLKFNDENIS